MNTKNMPVKSRGAVKSALSLQIEEFEAAQSESSTLVPVESFADNKKIRPVDPQYIQAIAQMITDERWYDLECFIKASVCDQTKESQSVFESRSPPQWRNTTGEQCFISKMNELSVKEVRRSEPDVNCLEIVHHACKHNPPRKVIKLLALLYPEGITIPDQMGRLPLHYATQCGGSGRLIHYLIQKDTLAASTKDNFGKTPLHLICENSGANCNVAEKMGLKCEESMMRVLKLLLDVSPDSVNIEDNNGMLPLEHAIESGSPYVVIKFLQMVSQNDWKRRSLQLQGHTHSNIVKKLNHDQQLKQREHERKRESVVKLSISMPTDRDKLERRKQTTSKSKSTFAKSA